MKSPRTGSYKVLDIPHLEKIYKDEQFSVVVKILNFALYTLFISINFRIHVNDVLLFCEHDRYMFLNYQLIAQRFIPKCSPSTVSSTGILPILNMDVI